MKLSEWRHINKLSQQAFAHKLAKFSDREIHIRTVGWWEQGTMPRKFWRDKLREFTDGKVTAADFE